MWGTCSFLLWQLWLQIRPSAMGILGYPYDVAIGLGMLTLASSLWTIYDVWVLLMRNVRRIDTNMT